MIAYNLEVALAAPDQVQTLVLYRRSISTWPDDLFRLKRLTHLELDHCDLTYLDERLLHLPLHTLKLPRNAIKTIPDWLQQMKTLRYLDLAQNGLTSFPADRFPPHLTHCILARNRLVQVPIQQLATLEHLDLRRNPLSRQQWPAMNPVLQEVFLEGSPAAAHRFLGSCFPHLKTLSITRSKLKDIPAEWPQLFPALQIIDLSSNWLEQLPGQFLNIGHHWQRLNLSKNRLTILPPDWITASQLRELDLSGNRLETLPTSLAGMAQLVRLNLTGNPLQGLPSELSSHQRLQVLNVKHTLLANLDSGPWPALEKLMLQGAPVSSREDVLRSLPARIKVTGKKRMDTPGELSLSRFRKKAEKAGWSSVHQARIWKFAEDISSGRKARLSIQDHLDLWKLGLPEYPDSLVRLSPGRKLPTQGRLLVYGRSWLPLHPLTQRAKPAGIDVVSSIEDHPNMILFGSPQGNPQCLHADQQSWWTPTHLMDVLPPLPPSQQIPEGLEAETTRLLRSGMPIYQAIARQTLQDYGIPRALYGEILLIVRMGLIPHLRKEWPGLIVQYGLGAWVVDCLRPKKEFKVNDLSLAKKWNVTPEALEHWWRE